MFEFADGMLAVIASDLTELVLNDGFLFGFSTFITFGHQGRVLFFDFGLMVHLLMEGNIIYEAMRQMQIN